jgi:hypothetical protein
VGDRSDFGIETLFEAVATGRPAAIVERGDASGLDNTTI